MFPDAVSVGEARSLTGFQKALCEGAGSVPKSAGRSRKCAHVCDAFIDLFPWQIVPVWGRMSPLVLRRATRRLWGQMYPLLISAPLTPLGHTATSPLNPPWVHCGFSSLLPPSFSSASNLLPGTSSLSDAAPSHRELSLGVWEGRGDDAVSEDFTSIWTMKGAALSQILEMLCV